MKIAFHDIDRYKDVLVMNSLLYDCISRDNDSYYTNIDGIEYHIRIHDSNFVQYKRAFTAVATSFTSMTMNVYCNKKYEKALREIFSKYC